MRLFNAVIPFLTARAIGTTTASRPLYALLSGGSVSNGPSISGTHHDCQTIIQYDGSVSNGACDRGKLVTTNRPTTCACCRVVPFLTARSYREPTAEAKPLLNAMIPFLTARAIGTITANRPLYIYACAFGWIPF